MSKVAKAKQAGLFLFEHRREPLLPQRDFARRMVNNGVIGALVLAIALSIGVFGYRWSAGLSWIDSLLNASMILGGMGPVESLQSDGAKLFASFYAIFSGVVFLAVFGIIAAPVYHRIIHRFHLEEDQNK